MAVQNAVDYPKMYLYRRIVQAKLYIDSHYTEKLDLNNISDEAYFSKFHFVRLFKNIYGKTPHHYLTQVRIDRAKQLLIANESISDTCFAVGFESPTSFTALFKKLTGMAPSAFRQNENRKAIHMAANPFQFVPNCFSETYGWIKE